MLKGLKRLPKKSKTKSDLPVSQHFNSPGHLLEYLRVRAVLKSGLAKKAVRKRNEIGKFWDKSRFVIYLKYQTHTCTILARANSLKTARDFK